MARIRTVKPSFWSDAGVARLSRDARLLMLGLVSFADDDGRFLASPAAVIGYVYPNDDDVTPTKYRKWIAEVEKHCRLHLYSIDGIAYGQLDRFGRHQSINKKQASTLPAPPGLDYDTTTGEVRE